MCNIWLLSIPHWLVLQKLLDYFLEQQSSEVVIQSLHYVICLNSSFVCFLRQTLITQTRAKQAATMSEVEWRGRTVPVKIDKARIFLLGLADNEAAIAQVSLHQQSGGCLST